MQPALPTADALSILIIEDDAGARANLQDILELDSYQVVTAATAAEALARRDWARYSAILLDWRLPDSTPEMLLPELQRRAPRAQVIIITGYGDLQGAIAALRLGAADYLLKPINANELRARLGHLVERLRAQEQRRCAEAALRQSHEELQRLVAELQAKDEEVRTMTQQLWQAAKLASVGELAAGIAHELNNPLATIRLRVESVLARTSPDDPRRRPLEIIEQESRRMGELVANLLQFSRRGTDQISTVDVREDLAKATELVLHQLRKRAITVVQEFATDTPVVHADRQKLRQVFLNLLTNASDAMPEGGTLTLRTAAAPSHDGQQALLIEFADTGVGIPPEHLERIMEPFFTTKEEGKGTGLGLAICRRVVHEHHGTIGITSEVGKGTTVRIVVPVQDDRCKANAERQRDGRVEHG
jgi:signal transduction histidine kinase